ncbi:MAG: aminotransferase class IV [Pirellulales bacterium]
MNEPLAYWNGRFVPFSQVSLPPYDAGFVQGTTVGEQLRTFGGRLYRLDEHLRRLSNSLEIVGVTPPVTLGTLGEISRSLASHNHRLLATGDDLGLSILITPGIYSAFACGARGGPTVIINTYPVAFDLFAANYDRGQALVVTDVRQVPADCWPVELKCRSRMHYYLADREARRREPGARALLLDHDGFVTEASTANMVAYFANEGLVSPPKEKILPGISVAALAQIANQLGIPFSERPLRAADLAAADELYLTSTSPCLIPCTQLDGNPIGNGLPGPVFQQLLEAWSRHVQVDIAAQAKQFASR